MPNTVGESKGISLLKLSGNHVLLIVVLELYVTVIMKFYCCAVCFCYSCMPMKFLVTNSIL